MYIKEIMSEKSLRHEACKQTLKLSKQFYMMLYKIDFDYLRIID